MSISFCQASSPAGLSGPAASPPVVAQILTSYTQLSMQLCEESDPASSSSSRILHTDARATNARPCRVYATLHSAGKTPPGVNRVQNDSKPVKASQPSPLLRAVERAGSTFYNLPAVQKLRKPFPAQSWCGQHPTPPAQAWLAQHPPAAPKPFPFPRPEPRKRLGLLARLAWLENAIRQRSIHPYPRVSNDSWLV